MFDELLYDPEIPNQPPLGFGFGVKRSDVFGVHDQLRRKRLSSSNNGKGTKRPRTKNTTHLLKALTSQMSDVLKAVRAGNASTEFLSATESVLSEINAQVCVYYLFLNFINFDF